VFSLINHPFYIRWYIMSPFPGGMTSFLILELIISLWGIKVIRGMNLFYFINQTKKVKSKKTRNQLISWTDTLQEKYRMTGGVDQITCLHFSGRYFPLHNCNFNLPYTICSHAGLGLMWRKQVWVMHYGEISGRLIIEFSAYRFEYQLATYSVG
jgi:hypothetical protein